MKLHKTTRLKNYDYKTNGYYFVTVVTRNKLPLLKNLKERIEKCIRDLPKFINGLKVDCFIVMDEHIHIIFVLEDCSRSLGQIVKAMKYSITRIVNVAAGLPHEVLFHKTSRGGVSPSHNKKVAVGLPHEVLFHKTSHGGVSPSHNKKDMSHGNATATIWEWNYYEHIIRNEKTLYEIRKYIQENPEKEKIDFKSIYSRINRTVKSHSNATATNIKNTSHRSPWRPTATTNSNLIKNILFILMLFPNLLFASGQGTTGLNFLKIGVGPKAIGMGEAFSAVADDASTLYWNPAGLFQLKHQEISFMYLSWFEGINYQFVGYVHPTEYHGSFGAGIYYLSSEDITAYDNYGDELPDKTRIYDLALGFSYARNIRKIKGLDAGITVKLIQESLSGKSAGIAAVDLGVLYRFKTDNSRDELRTAFVIQNLGPEITFFRDSHPLPQNFKVGISYELLNESLMLALDNNFPLDNEPFLNVGLSYRIADFVTLRAGYRFVQNKSEYDSDQGLRCGIGLGNEHISIDYAFVPYGVLGNTHRLGLTYKFGKRYGIDLIEAGIEKHVQKGRRYYQKKDLLSAYMEFSNVLVLDPINDEAEEYLQKIKEHTDKIVIEKQMNSARTYISEDKLLEAKELLENILTLYPEHTVAKDYLSLVEMKLEERSKQRIDAMYKQGLEFYKLKEYNEAISLWGKVLMLDPEYEEAKKHISLAQEELARIEAARRGKEKENLIKKSNELYNKGLKLYKSGRLEKAKRTFEESIKLNPEHRDSINYLNKTNTQLAEVYYNKGLKCYNEKNLGESIIYLQKAFYLNSQKEKIKELLDKVGLEFDEERRVKAEEYNKQALVEYTQGNLDKAIEYWEKALELNPEDTKIQNSLERAREELEKK